MKRPAAKPKAKTKAAAKSKPTEKTRKQKDGKEAKEELPAKPKKGEKRPAEHDLPEDEKDKKARKAKKETAEKDSPPSTEKPKTATWAGRWWPSDDHGSKKFQAIRHVYMEFCAHKLRSQAALASSFFSQVSKALQKKEIAAEAPLEEFIACAELEVDSFMASDRARCSASNFHFVLGLLVKL